ADRTALMRALNSGTVDNIATDHAPHLREEKEQDIWSAPAGVPGVETLLPLLLNEVNNKNISLKRVVELTSSNPSKIFRLENKGGLKRGFDADFVIVDLKEERKVDADRLFSKCGWSPFEGRTLRGWPTHTFVRGNLVFEDGAIIKNKGMEVGYF
ncbi:dihydroorotase family protein, partial [Candidatus Altiarchaeota archaeon]